MHELCPFLILLGANVGVLFSNQVRMKEDAVQVLFLSDLYAPEIGPTPASRGESREWTYIRTKQSWHSLLYVTPSVPQTGLDVWKQSGDSVICSQMGCGREEGRVGTQGFRGREEEPRGSARSQRGAREEPDSGFMEEPVWVQGA